MKNVFLTLWAPAKLKTFGWTFPRFCQNSAFRASLLGYPSNFTIYDSQDSLRAISGIIKEMQLDRDVYKPNY
jgi:hypothetical protein